MAPVIHNNRKRTPEEKAAQREAARIIRRRQRERDPGSLPAFRFNQAREVACEIMEVRYKPVPAPQSRNDLLGATSPFPEDRSQTFIPNSWEIMTDSL